jgi:2',3'-cyclic-nucleotide 2'-phosphodiesterase (5'-nucleotidase family)
MVDTMNNCGITHVCFGNHEADIPAQDLAHRISLDSKFVWLNTNMRELDGKLDVVTEPHQVIEVSHDGGSDYKYSKKKIGLMGLLTEDPSVYRPGVFGGATIEPVILFKRSVGSVELGFGNSSDASTDEFGSRLLCKIQGR